MAKAAVVCAACGAKVRADRVKCLRCGEPLVARKATLVVPARPVPWTTIGIVSGVVVLGGFSVMLTGGSTGTSVTQNVGSAMFQASVAPAAVVPPTRAAARARNAADPASVSVSNLLAGQKAYEGGNMDAALQKMQAAVDANPNDHRALNDLGQVLVRGGRAKDALQYLDKAAELEPESWTYQFNRARAHAQLKDWGPAVQGYQKASELFPEDYATHYNLAKALQASGNLSGALTGYEKAIQLAPGQSDFQLSYGLALEAANRPQDAATAYKRYLELEPQSPEAEKVKAHLAELQGAAPPSAPTKGTW